MGFSSPYRQCPFQSLAEGYDPQYVLMEDPLDKLTSAWGLFGSKYKWDKRWVVLTPTNLLYFKGGNPPEPGMAPKTDLYLGAGTRVEEVQEGELPVRALATAARDSPETGRIALRCVLSMAPALPLQTKEHREFCFAVITKGERDEDPEKETVFSCEDESMFDTWIKAVDQQCYLTQYAERNGMSMDTEGNFLNPDTGLVAASREDVLAEAQAGLAGDDDEEEEGEEDEVRPPSFCCRCRCCSEYKTWVFKSQCTPVAARPLCPGCRTSTMTTRMSTTRRRMRRGSRRWRRKRATATTRKRRTRRSSAGTCCPRRQDRHPRLRSRRH